MSESKRIDDYATDAGESLAGRESEHGVSGQEPPREGRPCEGLPGEAPPRERLTPRRSQPRRSGCDQLLDTGLFVEAIFSCPACGLSGTSIARPHMLVGKTCGACGEPVVFTVI
ncbi:MAG: hypothetical protein ACLP01_31705 [Solirubrobacteraceae bacterium]